MRSVHPSSPLSVFLPPKIFFFHLMTMLHTCRMEPLKTRHNIKTRRNHFSFREEISGGVSLHSESSPLNVTPWITFSSTAKPGSILPSHIILRCNWVVALMSWQYRPCQNKHGSKGPGPAALLIAQSGIVLSDWIYWPGGSAMFNEHLSH